jgi:hypothetical protein
MSMMAGRQLLGELTAAVSAPAGDEMETWLRQAG